MNIIYQTSLILGLFLFNSMAVYCQYQINIEIDSLKNNNGHVILAFMDENENIIKQIVSDIEEKKCNIVIENLKQGKYAFKYFHDENNNNKLDTRLFVVPKEGYGFSNNAEGRFGPPSFKEMIFELNENSRMTCQPIY